MRIIPGWNNLSAQPRWGVFLRVPFSAKSFRNALSRLYRRQHVVDVYVVAFTKRKGCQSCDARLTAETTSSLKKISWPPSTT